MAKFTDRSIKLLTLEPGQRDRLVFDDEMAGLGLRVSRNTKGREGLRYTFLIQWTDKVTGKKVREPIGVWGAITIEQARTAARAKFGEIARGVDPSAERKRKKAAAEADRMETALSLDRLVSQWTEIHLVSRSDRYRTEAPRAIRRAFAGHMGKPAARLTRANAVDVLDEMIRSGRKDMARLTSIYARACFSWAERREKVPANPFSRLPMAMKAIERDRVLALGEVAHIWSATAQLPQPVGPYLRIALLTLQRREEVAGMRWSEISADGTLWTIPAARMKNSRPHDVYLAPAAREVLRSILRHDGSDFVFTTAGRAALSSYYRGKIQLDAIMTDERAAEGLPPFAPWRLHDFRRTGVSHLAAMGFDSIVADKLLAHKPAKLLGVASVYQRHDFAAERRKALEAWAEHVTGAAIGGNVVRLRG